MRANADNQDLLTLSLQLAMSVSDRDVHDSLNVDRQRIDPSADVEAAHRLCSRSRELHGVVAGGGLAAAGSIVLMASPAASEIGDIVHVRDPVAYAASLLVIVTSCVLAVSVPALRAARIDLIATLRRD